MQLIASSHISTRCPVANELANSRLAYGFEASMVNEFHNLELLCLPPQLIPPYGDTANQGCTLPGAVAGSTTVHGEAYLEAQLQYSYSHLWRNVGIIFAFWAFFVLATLFGMEMTLKPSKGGGTVNIYKKGAAPKCMSVLQDEEAQIAESMIRSGREKGGVVEEFNGIAKSQTIFTWSGVRYVIQVKGGKKVLLEDVKGYVKPGRLTALMGGTEWVGNYA